jgi:epoxyqueuosine reductase
MTPDRRRSSAPVRRVPEAARLRSIGREAGLDEVGIASAEPFSVARRAIEARKAEGLDGGMQFTYRNPARATDPRAIVADARSLVVGARHYRRHDPPPPDRPAGRVARYARSDHYAELRGALGVVAGELRDAGWTARVVCDDNALVDRAAAHRAGIGWYGKNANVLVPGRGSWFVLGAVVTDAPLTPTAVDPVADGCGSCTRCIDACPTAAIVGPGVVDARRCLAWLVQAAGSFPLEHRRALGDRLYGCDDCQEVCPPNRTDDRHHGIAPGEPGDEVWVSLLDLLASTDDELLARHGRWYVPGRDPRYLRRNALVVLGNVARADDVAVRGVLRSIADGDDELLAEHARWAQDQLDERSAAFVPTTA